MSQIPKIVDFPIADDSCPSTISQNWLMTSGYIDDRKSSVTKDCAIESVDSPVIRTPMRQGIQHAIYGLCISYSKTSCYTTHKYLTSLHSYLLSGLTIFLMREKGGHSRPFLSTSFKRRLIVKFCKIIFCSRRWQHNGYRPFSYLKGSHRTVCFSYAGGNSFKNSS